MCRLFDALMAGRIYGAPQRRTSKTGNAFVIAKVRTPMANGESLFVNVIAFSKNAAFGMKNEYHAIQAPTCE